MDKKDWITWLLVDSALPVGGFVASNGLEVAFQLGKVKEAASLQAFLKSFLKNQSYSACHLFDHFKIPFGSVDKLSLMDYFRLDKEYDALIGTNHVSRRSSMAQGLAYLSLVTRSFETQSDSFDIILQYKKAILVTQTPGHLPVCFGLVCMHLGIPAEDMKPMYLYLQAKGVISAAVRLNVVGPYVAQSLLYDCFEIIRDLDHLKTGFQTDPIQDIMQGCHDQLYSRIFNS